MCKLSEQGGPVTPTCWHPLCGCVFWLWAGCPGLCRDVLAFVGMSWPLSGLSWPLSGCPGACLQAGGQACWRFPRGNSHDNSSSRDVYDRRGWLVEVSLFAYITKKAVRFLHLVSGAACSLSACCLWLVRLLQFEIPSSYEALAVRHHIVLVYHSSSSS